MSKYVAIKRHPAKFLANFSNIIQVKRARQESTAVPHSSQQKYLVKIFAKNTEIICFSKDPDLRLMTVNKSYSQKLN